MNNIIIGKRTTVGAAITSLAGVFAHFFPEDAAAIIGLAVPLTFIIQKLHQLTKFFCISKKLHMFAKLIFNKKGEI